MTFTLDVPTLSADDPAARLDADFFDFQSRLTPLEQRALARIHAFLDAEVRPHADDFWERAESPKRLWPRFAELGLFGGAFPETAQFDNSSVFRGWVAMEISPAPTPPPRRSSACTADCS